MDLPSAKNDIKTLFLIVNSINALVTGLFPISLGMATSVSDVEVLPAIHGIAVGMPLLGLASLGCYGAINENKTMLNIYSALNGLISLVEMVAVAAHLSTSASFMFNRGFLQLALFHNGLTLAVLALAIFLAKQAPTEETLGAVSTSRPLFWKCFLCVVSVFGVILVVYMM